MSNNVTKISEIQSAFWFFLVLSAILIPILVMTIIEIFEETSKGGEDQMASNFEILKSKSAFSNIVSEDQVLRRYRGLAIVESEKGFNSEEEIDEFVRLSLNK